jgi:uncharacterized membrane protein
VTRATLWLMIPVNLFLLAWVWLGRLVFGVGGWFMLILIPAVLVLAVLLLLTTVLALTQEGSPRRLTTAQTGAQLTLWVALLVLGAFMPDFGDTDDSARSLLTQVFGYSDELYDASFGVALVAALVALVAWVVLLVTLTAGRRRLAA